MASKKLTRKRMIDAIKTAKGKVTLAAQTLGISRDTVYRYAKKYEEIQAAIDDARLEFDESLLDFAEFKLRQAVLDGEQWAIRYALDKKGHNRGYVERNELTGKDGGAIEHNVKMRWEEIMNGDSTTEDDPFA